MNSTTASTSGGAGSVDSTAPKKNSKRPKYSRFTQQELPACKPILTPQWVISAFTLVSFIFIPIGVASLLASRDVVEIVDRYETECIPEASRNNKIQFIQSAENKTCNRNITVPKHMKPSIYVYYQLDNFYQNHRRFHTLLTRTTTTLSQITICVACTIAALKEYCQYKPFSWPFLGSGFIQELYHFGYVKSRSDAQLKSPKKEKETGTCAPEADNNGTSIVPCGLIAWSLFNDTYSFSRKNQQLTVNKKGISWKSDRDSKFGNDVFPKNFQNGTLIGGAKLDPKKPLSEQEDLIVWMRTAALPTFRKLYGKIEVELQENDVIQVTLQNNYNTYSFGGRKKLVLSTTSWLGGKNEFLGIAYLTVGGLCFFLAMAFTVIYLLKPRKLGDPSYLSWNRNPSGH